MIPDPSELAMMEKNVLILDDWDHRTKRKRTTQGVGIIIVILLPIAELL